MTWAILFDLDDTLVMTSAIELYRRKAYWPGIHQYFDQTGLPAYTWPFLEWVRPYFSLGVVTSSPRFYAEQLIAHHGLSLPVLAAYHDTAKHKPDPDPLLFAAKQLGVSPSRCFHIGNNANDMVAAYRAKMIPIHLCWDESAEEVQFGYACSNWLEVLACLKRSLEERSIRDASDLCKEEKICLFPYHPTYTESRDEITDKIIAFKENQAPAVHWFKGYAEQAIRSYENALLSLASPWYVVAIPGSRSRAPNTPCEQVCAHLATKFIWIIHLPNALERKETVSKSSTARKEKRPRTSQETHKKTIRYVGCPDLISVSGMLLIDDVLTTANTFHACRDILREVITCRHIFGLFMGRTQLDT